MERITKYNNKTNDYELIDNRQDFSRQIMINRLGKYEDQIENLSQKSEVLLHSMMELLEITKSEEEELMKQLMSYK